MNVATVLRYLCGSRTAIERIAASRGGLGVGLLFVLAAGFAREYDGEDLLAEPWHLLLPLGASLALSLTLFALARLGTRADETYPGFRRAYGSFLALFWMTAPLALLYAVPYERFLSAGDSVRANLWTLAVVSAWRIFLMTRVIAVLFGAGVVGAFLIVMAMADGAALLLLSQATLPVIDLMGGIRLTDAERTIASTAFLVAVFGTLSLLLWVPGLLVMLSLRRLRWKGPPPSAAGGRPSAGLVLLALLCIAGWATLLPFTQPPQRLRHRVEVELRQGRIGSGLALMSARRPEDFPPHWEPPPRPGYEETEPPLLDVLEFLATHDAAPWVRAAYVDKFERRYLTRFGPLSYAGARELDRVEQMIEALPEGPALLAESEWLQKLLDVRREERRAAQTRPATSPARP